MNSKTLVTFYFFARFSLRQGDQIFLPRGPRPPR